MSNDTYRPLRYVCPVCQRSKVAEEGERCFLCDMDEDDQILMDRDMGDS